MRTLSSTTARLQSVATQPSQLIARLQSWWVAYLEWRIQREAMLQLKLWAIASCTTLACGAVKSKASSKVGSSASALSAGITE